ncbi:MAG: hypothetical protein KKF62_16220 [Bacteroidetes bacterium]|nr:hypothetical protein [Bacteroidota bacterium]MBU1800514.1 hypothetical protein [Bacteroidota bacterium]
MKIMLIFLITILFRSTFTFCQTNGKEFPVLKGSYLGQNPTGNEPELFAPGIISREGYFEHSAAVFSPDGNEVYWSGEPDETRHFEIYFMKIVNEQWTEPKIAFSCESNNFNNPVFSSDGNKLFFNKDGDIWFVERKGKEWSSAVKLPSIINTSASERMCSITNDGSIYFTRYPEFEVYVSKKVNDNYLEPIKLDRSINFDNYRKMSVYVAPDESYLILEASKDAATCELFVSHRMKNGKWSECQKLPIKWGRFPTVSPDGKYLFFMTREGIYWVSAKIIEKLKPKELK